MDSKRTRAKATPVSAEEQDAIKRLLLGIFNSYDGLPISMVDFEFLPERNGLAIFPLEDAHKQKQYICGGYMTQYQFQLIYKLYARNIEARLDADNMLNQIAAFAEAIIPDGLPENVSRWKLRRAGGASLADRDDGKAIEYHTINFNLTYEVNV